MKVPSQIARWSISNERKLVLSFSTGTQECSLPSCVSLPLRQQQLAADHHVEGDIFKNVLLCQLDVKQAILKSVRPPLRKFGLNPSVVQFNFRKNPAFLLDDYPSLFAVNHLFFVSVRVINNLQNWVCDEESWSVINPDCSRVACSWSYSRGAAGEEGPPGRVSIVARPSS